MGLWLVFIYLILYFFHTFRREIEFVVLVKWLKQQPLTSIHRQLLQKSSGFYNQLSLEDKLKFDFRVRRFMNNKEFLPRGLRIVTEEMKLLISSSAVHLSFGFNRYDFPSFEKIIVYNNDYYSTFNKTYHAGEVNPGFRLIVLSWTTFMKGIDNLTDGVNLGIHEMAHALRLENIMPHSPIDDFGNSQLRVWNLLVNTELEKPEVERSNFLRSRAYVNSHEFFSVCVENLFERTDEFEEVEPALFYAILDLLKLNRYF